MPGMKGKSAGAVPSFTFAQLESFVGLARWGKQAAVRAALGKSQPQVSRDLQALERALGGVVLFNRTSRQATPAGELVLRFAAEAGEGWRRLRDRLSGEADSAGEVALALDPDVCPALLPVLAALKRRIPGLVVRTLVADAAAGSQALRSGRAAVAILCGGEEQAGLQQRPLLQAETWVALPAQGVLARHKEFTASMLAGQPLLLAGGGSGFGMAWAGRYQGHRAVRFEFLEFGPGRETLLEAVAAGLGLALVPVFVEAGDPLPAQLPAGVVLKRTRGLGTTGYTLAIRRGLKPGGPAGTLIRSLLRRFVRGGKASAGLA